MAAKTERVEVRVPAEVKDIIERAAAWSGCTLSDFVRDAARDKAVAVVRESSELRLSNRDRDTFLAMLDNPPKPNKALKDAAMKYRRAVKSGKFNGVAS